jgi:small-conductance mechanosensitive channel
MSTVNSPYFDAQSVVHLVQSAVIVVIAAILLGMVSRRMHLFARWANLPRLALAPLRFILRAGIVVLAVILVMERWGFQTTSLVAVLGTVLGLVAIGFVATWSLLSNFLCTFVLILFKPFSVGDELELPTVANTRGRVVDLSLIFTTLQDEEGHTIIIPNNTFFTTIYRRKAGDETIELHEQLARDEPHQRGS